MEGPSGKVKGKVALGAILTPLANKNPRKCKAGLGSKHCTGTPPSQSVNAGKDYHFMFILDRSGSMGASAGAHGTKTRIELAKAALKLFVKSLPKGC